MKKNEIIVKRMRNNPFKTTLIPSFEIDWGTDYGISGYPETEMNDVKVFDIKEFVDKKREEQGLPPQFSPSSMVPPFSPFNSKGFGGNSAPVNVDELIKNIDKKIAELEEEERRKSNESSESGNISEVINDDNVSKVVESEDAEQKIKDEEEKYKREKEILEKPNINVDESSIVINDNVIDDDFFDDFFDDEE